ncbi:hypothetical protein EVAR_44768_1 [Eumeta japonica]|uniref:Uncharacterized protein n=1 Tax=Eumeta variegata TaxID=151549 RepID=A0A4C1Y962_EUMVA|nr:hypothetical protein EVAR_44768_1 [Eumeta japonica]
MLLKLWPLRSSITLLRECNYRLEGAAVQKYTASLMKYPTRTEYGHEIAASAVVFRLVSESSDGSLSFSPLLSTRFLSIRNPIPSQEAGNALATPLRLLFPSSALFYSPMLVALRLCYNNSQYMG